MGRESLALSRTRQAHTVAKPCPTKELPPDLQVTATLILHLPLSHTYPLAQREGSVTVRDVSNKLGDKSWGFMRSLNLSRQAMRFTLTTRQAFKTARRPFPSPARVIFPPAMLMPWAEPTLCSRMIPPKPCVPFPCQ